MSATKTNFAHNLQLAASAVTIIPAVNTGVQASVSACSFYNSGSSARTVSVFVVESGGSASVDNTIAIKVVQPNKTWICVEVLRQVFASGMSLQASQDAGSDVNVNASGVYNS